MSEFLVNSHEIIIRSENRLLKCSWIAILYTGWLIGGFAFINKLFAREPSDILAIAYFGLIFWMIASVMFILSFVWVLFGAQVATLLDHELIAGCRVGQIAIARPRIFLRAAVKDMRIERRGYGYKGKKAIKYAITFKYRGRTKSLFVSLSERRAKSLLSDPLHEFVRG